MTSRTNLLSKLIFCLALSTGLLAATTRASAQTQLRATIPFAFTADNVTFPAGHYTVSRHTNNESFLYLCNDETRVTRPLMVRPDSGGSTSGQPRLTFRRQPGGIYLSQVWTMETSEHIELMSHPKAAAEVAKSSPEMATFEIAAK